MKFYKLLVVCLFTTLSLYACSNGESKAKEGSAEESYAYTAAYICPMHCEGSGSKEAGKCPECKMDYVQNDSKKHEGHEHHNHEHDHHNHEGHNH
jgi:hypothetical protein